MSATGDQGATLADLGEREVLARILPLLPAPPAGQIGPGDDAAVVDWPSERLVVTVDMMVEGPDFRLDWSSGHDIGWKAMASNLADCFAMGAQPRCLVIALAAPPSSDVALLEDIARGIAGGIEAMAPGAHVVGGDLSASSVLTLSVTVFGDLEGRAPVLRSGARAGDVVAVCGELGRSARGFATLSNQTATGMIASLKDAQALSERDGDVRHHLAPTPPLWRGIEAARHGATALMDISDGLLLDATRMAVASGVAMDLDVSLAGQTDALTGGEDHGFLACFPPEPPLPEGFRRIGAVIPWMTGDMRVVVGGEDPGQPSSGWDPYS